MYLYQRFCILVLCFLLSGGFFVYAQSGTGTGALTIDALVPGCGDGLVGVGEQCDGLNLGGNTCGSVGFSGGTLSCTLSCTFNTTACSTSGGSGGGGGSSSSGSSASRGAQVVLTGRAYPRSTVTVLKDAQVVATTIAGNDARFQVGIQTLSAGSYIFSVYSEDTKGNKSALLSFPVSVTKNIVAKIENIFIAPTLATDKQEVRRGDPIVLFGQSTPVSTVTLEVNSQQQIFVKTDSDSSGAYLHTFDTSVLEFGDHDARARASAGNLISPLSNSASFVVGTKNVYAQTPVTCSYKADFNKDCRVNLVDFSIAAFWYNRTLSDAFLVREKEHVNGDGKINLVDFSIMAFYWTG
jgi:hypothetical protein